MFVTREEAMERDERLARRESRKIAAEKERAWNPFTIFRIKKNYLSVTAQREKFLTEFYCKTYKKSDRKYHYFNEFTLCPNMICNIIRYKEDRYINQY